MSHRDKELWGMLWRFGLVVLLVSVATKITGDIFKGNIALNCIVSLAIVLLPLYLANRAHSQASK